MKANVIFRRVRGRIVPIVADAARKIGEGAGRAHKKNPLVTGAIAVSLAGAAATKTRRLALKKYNKRSRGQFKSDTKNFAVDAALTVGYLGAARRGARRAGLSTEKLDAAVMSIGKFAHKVYKKF